MSVSRGMAFRSFHTILESQTLPPRMLLRHTRERPNGSSQKLLEQRMSNVMIFDYGKISYSSEPNLI